MRNTPRCPLCYGYFFKGERCPLCGYPAPETSTHSSPQRYWVVLWRLPTERGWRRRNFEDGAEGRERAKRFMRPLKAAGWEVRYYPAGFHSSDPDWSWITGFFEADGWIRARVIPEGYKGELEILQRRKENLDVISQFIEKETGIRATITKRTMMGRIYPAISYGKVPQILTILQRMLPYITTPHWKSRVKTYIEITEKHGKERIPKEEAMHRYKLANMWRNTVKKIEELKKKHPWLKQ